MAIETEPPFRLSVWRPARLARPLTLESEGAGQPPCSELSVEALHEQIYTWVPQEAGVISEADPSTANQIREVLVERFNPHHPPADRSFGRFRDALETISNVLARREAVWSECETRARGLEDPDTLLRSDPLRGLHLHLTWIFGVFKDVPGASVAVR